MSRRDAPLVDAVVSASEADPDAVRGRVSDAVSETEVWERRLRSAGVYPLVVGLSALAPAVALGGFMLPVFGATTGGAELPGVAWVPVVAGIVVVALTTLSLLVLGRVRAPGVGEAWMALDRHVFYVSVAALSADGLAAHDAVRAAGAWCRTVPRAAADDLARALEAGGSPAEAEPLMSPFETRVLVSGASSGTLQTAAEALAAQQRVLLTRAVPGAATRVEAVALSVAGAAILALGVVFFSAYAHVLAG